MNNWDERVQVLSVACSNRIGVAKFAIAKRSRSTNHLEGFGTTQTGGIREIQCVATVTLNSLLQEFSSPDLIKIDVEGAEALVLQEVDKVLQNRPALIIEVAKESSDSVRAILDQFNYSYFDGKDLSLVRDEVLPYTTVAVCNGA